MIFERLFVDAFANTPESVQAEYFQGETDVFELIFLLYLDAGKCREHADWFQFTDTNFESFQGDVSCFFAVDYDKLISIFLNVLDYVCALQDCEIQKMLSQSDQVRDYVRQYDSQLFGYLQTVDAKTQSLVLLQLSISLCLHVCKSLDIGFKLATLYLTTTRDQQSFIVQQLLSCAARKLSDSFANSNYDYMYYIDATVEKGPGDCALTSDSAYERAQYILGRAVPALLIPRNAKAVNAFLDGLIQKYERYALHKTVKTAAAVGAGVVALGAIGGILGAVLGHLK